MIMLISDPSATVCFTGHRPEHLPFGSSLSDPRFLALYNRLFAAVSEAIDAGYRHFIAGMARGVDTMAAEIVLCVRDASFRSKHARTDAVRRYELGRVAGGITLTAAIPFPGQSDRWAAPDKERYALILSRCDDARTLSPFYSKECMHVRNRWMVDMSSLLIAAYNGKESGGTYQTVAYAMGRNVDVKRIWIDDEGSQNIND